MDEGLTRSIRRKKYLKMRIAGGGERTYLCPYMLGLLSTNPSPSLTCNGTTQQKDDDTVPCDTHRIVVVVVVVVCRCISAEEKAGSNNGMNAFAYEEKLRIRGGFIRSTCVDLRTTYVDIWI